MQDQRRTAPALVGRPGHMRRQKLELGYNAGGQLLPAVGGPFLYARVFSRIYDRLITICVKESRREYDVCVNFWHVRRTIKPGDMVYIYLMDGDTESFIGADEYTPAILAWLSPEVRMEVNRERVRILSDMEKLAARTPTDEVTLEDVDYF